MISSKIHLKLQRGSFSISTTVAQKSLSAFSLEHNGKYARCTRSLHQFGVKRLLMALTPATAFASFRAHTVKLHRHK